MQDGELKGASVMNKAGKQRPKIAKVKSKRASQKNEDEEYGDESRMMTRTEDENGKAQSLQAGQRGEDIMDVEDMKKTKSPRLNHSFTRYDVFSLFEEWKAKIQTIDQDSKTVLLAEILCRLSLFESEEGIQLYQFVSIKVNRLSLPSRNSLTTAPSELVGMRRKSENLGIRTQSSPRETSRVKAHKDRRSLGQASSSSPDLTNRTKEPLEALPPSSLSSSLPSPTSPTNLTLSEVSTKDNRRDLETGSVHAHKKQVDSPRGERATGDSSTTSSEGLGTLTSRKSGFLGESPLHSILFVQTFLLVRCTVVRIILEFS